MRMWDKANEDVLKGMLRNTCRPYPCGKPLSEAPWLRLSFWSSWLQYGLRSVEDSLDLVVVLSPSFTEAFAEGNEIVEQAEAGEYTGTPEDLEKEIARQEGRLRHLRACWESAQVLIAILSVESEGNHMSIDCMMAKHRWLCGGGGRPPIGRVWHTWLLAC